MFVVASASFRLLYVMIILAHDRRNIVRAAVTEHPTAAWLSRQVTEAFPWDTAPRSNVDPLWLKAAEVKLAHRSEIGGARRNLSSLLRLMLWRL
jgi:hypothetical protein